MPQNSPTAPITRSSLAVAQATQTLTLLPDTANTRRLAKICKIATLRYQLRERAA